MRMFRFENIMFDILVKYDESFISETLNFLLDDSIAFSDSQSLEEPHGPGFFIKVFATHSIPACRCNFIREYRYGTK